MRIILVKDGYKKFGDILQLLDIPHTPYNNNLDDLQQIIEDVVGS